VSSLNEIPWGTLRSHAQAATAKSYAPYSHVTVGAAGYTNDGRFVEGANVENMRCSDRRLTESGVQCLFPESYRVHAEVFPGQGRS